VGARVVAALVAAAMVVGAVMVRRALDGDGNSGNGNGGGPQVATRTVCASDVQEDVCFPRDDVEPEGATADALIEAAGAEDGDLRAWLTVGPWPQMVDDARRSAGKPRLFSDVRTLASTELVAVVRRKPDQCTGEVTWRCLGDAAVAGARVAAPPRGTGIRLLATAAFAGAYLGRSDYASNDITDDPAAADWLAAVDRGIEDARQFASTLDDALVKQGAVDVFVTTLADATAGATPPGQVTVAQPVVRATAYLGTAGRFDADEVADRLQLFHWRSPPQPPAGLPSPGVLLALREVSG
jgi:hypothetical protein